MRLYQFFAVIALTAICSCGFNYTKKGFWGGYKDSKVDDYTYWVTYTGNRMLDEYKVDRYCFYRCAQLTELKKWKYFIVIDEHRSSYTAHSLNGDEESFTSEKEIRFVDHYSSGVYSAADILSEKRRKRD